MDKIDPSKVLFIKLGEKGCFEQDCLTKEQTLKVGFNKVAHESCKDGKWEVVSQLVKDAYEYKHSSTTSYQTNQLKQFYEEGEDTLWITFYMNKMWWCFAEKEVSLLSDGTRIRRVKGHWSDKDIYGNPLLASNLSGTLLKTQGFRGTICGVGASQYAIAKINGEKTKEVVELENALNILKSKLAKIIQSLCWEDYEILIDLIFRESGWKRLGVLGKTQKIIDLDLYAPVTDERSAVQIKAESDKAQFLQYCDDFKKMDKDYKKFFYVVHTPSKDLEEYKKELSVTLRKDLKENKKEPEITLYFADKIADLTISSGLVDWVMERIS